MRIKEIETFPKDKESIVLAYEQSKSLIDYIMTQYGNERIVRILLYAREGNSAEEAVQKSLSASLTEVEHKWHAYLRGKHSWFSYLSNNLYTVLFLLGGLITVYGFMRFLKMKRQYVDEEEGDGL